MERINSKYKLLLKKSTNEEWFVHSFDEEAIQEYDYGTNNLYYYENIFNKTNYFTIYPLILIAIVATIYIFISCLQKFDVDDKEPITNNIHNPSQGDAMSIMFTCFFLSGNFFKRIGLYFLIPIFNLFISSVFPNIFHDYSSLLFATLALSSTINIFVINKVYALNIDYINKKLDNHINHIGILRKRMTILHLIVCIIIFYFLLQFLYPDVLVFRTELVLSRYIILLYFFANNCLYSFLYLFKHSGLELKIDNINHSRTLNIIFFISSWAIYFSIVIFFYYFIFYLI